jgi:hypothetical protein
MNVIEYTPQSDGKSRDKLANAANAMNMAEAGRIWLPDDDPAFPLEEVEAQLLRFTGDPKRDAHDDIVDTLSKAANVVLGREPKQQGVFSGSPIARPGLPIAPPAARMPLSASMEMLQRRLKENNLPALRWF